jgi:acetyl esterase/lipase
VLPSKFCGSAVALAVPVFPMCIRIQILALMLTSALASQGAFGASPEKITLDRTEPVPADRPVPVMDFFRPLLLESPKLNETGTHIAALVNAGEDRHDLLISDLDKGTFEVIHGGTNKDIYSVHWLDAGRFLFEVSADKLYGLGLIAADVRRPRQGRAILQYVGARLVSIPEKDRLRPLIWASSDAFNGGRDRGVVTVDTTVDTGPLINLFAAGADHSRMRDAEANNERHIVKDYPVAPGGHGWSYIADREGALAFAITSVDGLRTLHRLVNGAWVRCPVDLEQIEIITCGDNDGELVVLAPMQDGKPRALCFMEAATGQLGAVLVQDANYEFNGWLWRDPTSFQIVGAVYDRAGPYVVWFNDEYRALQKQVDAVFPKKVVRLIGASKTGGRLLVAVYSDRQPVIYNYVDLAKGVVNLIKNSSPWIDPERMQPMSMMQFKTRHGEKLDAYVTLPKGASKQNPAPLIVLSHGGPWVRDRWGFNGEVLFLASRGYAVLQTNYRGSTGYDWMFPADDIWAFRKMHDDVTDATKALLASGMIDRARVGIMGTSFGAYLALSGVVHEPDLYRCAVTIAGVFDWETVIGNLKYYQFETPFYARMKLKLGDPKKDVAKFNAISPVRHMQNVKVPMFVSHGKQDNIANISESRRLISELKKYDLPHETFLVSGEGHGMSYLKHNVELYSRIESFLAKNMGASDTKTKP